MDDPGDERELLERFRDRRQREAAFTELVDRYQGRIFRHLMRMVGDRHDAEDLTQNVFVRIWRKLDGFRGDSKLYTWIYRIATNEALGHLDKRKRRRTLPIEEQHPGEGRSPGVQLISSSPVDGDALLERLERAVEELPARQKQVFIMRYWENMGYREMAGILDLSEGALKASYFHAVKKIEAAIRD